LLLIKIYANSIGATWGGGVIVCKLNVCTLKAKFKLILNKFIII